MIVVESVCHAFTRPGAPAQTVLDSINLTVPDGAFLSILGPTGCGKTTLLRIIDGLLRPTSGRVVIDGHPVLGPSADRAIVFQEFNLLPWRTARANVELGLELQGVGRADRRRAGEAALGLIGLTRFAEHYPHELSGGMKQRLGLARALCSGSRYLLMDEPFGALDLQTRELMQIELAALLVRERKTVLFVTHSVDEALLLSDHIVVLSAQSARVLERIDVPWARPHPSEWPALRASAAFNEHRQMAWDLLASQSHEFMAVGSAR